MRRLTGVALATSLVTACTDPVASLGDLIEVDDTDTGADEGTQTDGPEPVPVTLGVEPPRGIDILVVVDNTAGTLEEQAALAESLSVIAQSLAALSDVRIAFTTTDNGNPQCSGTSPETGALVLSSCVERMDEIGDPAGCTDFCELPGFTTLPTTTSDDPEPRSRPWLEVIGGVVNLDVDFREAISCAIPQGVAGCGYEQPLEAMYDALRGTTTSGSPSAGFLRPDAALAIVVVTTAVDCSYEPTWQEVFTPANMVFWQTDVATPAICWNAGVNCGVDDGRGNWTQCIAEDRSIEGLPTAVPTEAVMQPVARYTDLLDDITASKSAYLTTPALTMVAFAGVPVGYPETTQLFPQTGDGVDTFGVGPGCGSTEGEALPPARLREVVEAETDTVAGHLLSVCDLDYGSALQPILTVAPPMPPLCYPVCAADLDEDSGGLQPSCTVTQERGTPGGRLSEVIVPCLGVPAAPELPADVDVCWYARIDRVGSTPDVADDVDPTCIEAATNLQVQLVRRAGFPAPGGTTILAVCEQDPACP